MTLIDIDDLKYWKKARKLKTKGVRGDNDPESTKEEYAVLHKDKENWLTEIGFKVFEHDEKIEKEEE